MAARLRLELHRAGRRPRTSHMDVLRRRPAPCSTPPSRCSAPRSAPPRSPARCWRYPLMTAQVIAAIHWQALRAVAEAHSRPRPSLHVPCQEFAMKTSPIPPGRPRARPGTSAAPACSIASCAGSCAVNSPNSSTAACVLDDDEAGIEFGDAEASHADTADPHGSARSGASTAPSLPTAAWAPASRTWTACGLRRPGRRWCRCWCATATCSMAWKRPGPRWRHRAALLHALRRNTRDGSRRNIAAHYDLGNDFFGLFLDADMMYSSRDLRTSPT